MKYLALVLVGCSHPDTCSVEASGNYAETSASASYCPTLAAGAGATRGDTLLNFDLAALHYKVTLDLGPVATPGTYNSGTTSLWSASAIRAVRPDGACMFLAGNNAIPSGSFVLELSSIDRTVQTAHGTLALTLYVLPRASDKGKQTDCGRGTTEQLLVRF